jgi:hypothetical protein
MIEKLFVEVNKIKGRELKRKLQSGTTKGSGVS